MYRYLNAFCWVDHRNIEKRNWVEYTHTTQDHILMAWKKRGKITDSFLERLSFDWKMYEKRLCINHNKILHYTEWVFRVPTIQLFHSCWFAIVQKRLEKCRAMMLMLMTTKTASMIVKRSQFLWLARVWANHETWLECVRYNVIKWAIAKGKITIITERLFFDWKTKIEWNRLKTTENVQSHYFSPSNKYNYMEPVYTNEIDRNS